MMLTLQHFTSGGWQSLLCYESGDAARMQQAATAMSHYSGIRWRVLGSDGRVLTVWDGRRWHVAGESTTMPAWWGADAGQTADTVPT